ncbi:MAG: hypothetical protein R2755_34075 [Acidimicrobiales bacterium]
MAYLGTADCPFSGATFYVQGGMVKIFRSWEMGDGVEQDDRWTVDGLSRAMAPLADLPYAKAPNMNG